MAADIGWKVTDDREVSVLRAYQRCINEGAGRFIIEQTTDPSELEAALHLLLTDVWPRVAYRIRPVVKSGVFLRFEEQRRAGVREIVGEWIGNRCHGVVDVYALARVRAVAGN